MIILVWRLFHRYVIGTKWMKPRCQDSDCGLSPFPICHAGRCRRHCLSRCPNSRGCEDALSSDELDLVKQFRDGRLLDERKAG